MYSLFEKVRAKWSWLLSFARPGIKPEHYPLRVHKQSDVPESATWCAQVIHWPGPAGLGATRQQAVDSLLKTLSEIQVHRRSEGRTMPRPGVHVPIEFAPTDRVDSDPVLRDEFISKVLGFGPDEPVFISDQSSICDFGDDERIAEIRANIFNFYGVQITQPEPVYLADVLEAIRFAHRPNP